MHEEQAPREYVFEKIKIDDIKGDFLIEYKKTSSNIEEKDVGSWLENSNKIFRVVVSILIHLVNDISNYLY